MGRLSSEGDLWLGRVRCFGTGRACFCVMDFEEGCNEKEANIEETNIVKRVL
jgi:hypothetical protein